MDDLELDLRSKLHGETAKIGWPELVRHFARGVVVVAAPELDLVEVAHAMANDEAERVQAWMQAGQLARASDEQAAGWHERQPTFWAVVVAPWVVIQETRPTLDS